MRRYLGLVGVVVLGLIALAYAQEPIANLRATNTAVGDSIALDVAVKESAGSATDTAHLAAIETAIEALQADVATGNTLKRYISAGATEDESQVKATAGILVSVSARNSHATADAYLKCTNATAANTDPGTTAVFYEILIPAGPSGNNDSDIFATFDTALTCYIVLSKEDTAEDEVAASTVSYNLRYR